MKPFFFSVWGEKLDQETSRVLEGFRAGETSGRALEWFVLCTKLGGPFGNQEAVDRQRGDHWLRAAAGRQGEHDPVRSLADRDRLAGLGVHLTRDDDVSADLADRQKGLTDAVRETQRAAALYAEYDSYLETAIEKEHARSREESLGAPYDEKEEDPARLFPAGVRHGDLLTLENLGTDMAEARAWIRDHEHELSTLLTDHDWLQVYADGVTKYDLDMDRLLQRLMRAEDYQEDLDDHGSQLARLQAEFGNDVQWAHLAEYATFISSLRIEGAKQSESADAADNFEQMMEFMANRAKNASERSDDVARESIFRSIVNKKYSGQSAHRSEDVLLQEINDFASLDQRVQERRQSEIECLRLTEFAPIETREHV